MEILYQVEALKDDYEELQENYRLLQKELKCRARQHETLKRDHKELGNELESQKLQSEERFKVQEEENSKLVANIQQIEEELERIKKLLEESEKIREELQNKQVPVLDDAALTRETYKQTKSRDYEYKWKVAEQEKIRLKTACTRLEKQVAQHSQSLKEAETVEEELRAEKRKLLRELRESQDKVEELETNNSHLQKRLDRLRSSRLAAGGDTLTTTIASSTTPNSSLNSIPNSTNK